MVPPWLQNACTTLKNVFWKELFLIFINWIIRDAAMIQNITEIQSWRLKGARKEVQLNSSCMAMYTLVLKLKKIQILFLKFFWNLLKELKLTQLIDMEKYNQKNQLFQEKIYNYVECQRFHDHQEIETLLFWSHLGKLLHIPM